MNLNSIDEQTERLTRPALTAPPAKPLQSPLAPQPRPYIQSPSERISEALQAFQEAPKGATFDPLEAALKSYQQAANEGMETPRLVPPPLPRASTYSEWYRRFLTESVTMFRIRPGDDRLEAVLSAVREYQDAVFKGRIKPL